MLVGQVDKVYTLLKLCMPRRHKFFADGWGDIDAVHQSQQLFLRKLSDGEPMSPPILGKLAWERTGQLAGATMFTATFESPLHALLPPESKRCRVLAVVPSSVGAGGSILASGNCPRGVLGAVLGLRVSLANLQGG